MATSESGFPIERVYGQPLPGDFPYTRGIHPGMYTDRLWTTRQYAGFGTAATTNERFRQLLATGTTGLSVAFDLPTQMGMDSDHPLAHGEVGKVGVAIDSIEDMRELFAQIPLDQVSTSMTINAPAGILLALYELVAEEQGVSAASLQGTIQNDVLKEYIARGTFIFPPRESVRFTTDVIDYCRTNLPLWNSMSISGYHMGEAGATPVQEVAYTLANAIAYVEAALARGLSVDEFAPRLAFFFVARTTLFEEAAKYRAARTVWATIMRDRFGATNPKSQMLRFHTQTAGVQLTAQQPDVNVVRVTLQALGAVLGGTQSLHTNSFDEALALPSENAARLAIRTQQVIAHESGAASTVDPLAGSYFVEALTSQIEKEITSELAEIEKRGGAIKAIEAGYQKLEIEKNAYKIAQQIESGQRVVVGLNSFVEADSATTQTHRVDASLETAQRERLAAFKANRNAQQIADLLSRITQAAKADDNVMPVIKEALRHYATVGEVCDALRAAWGTYQATDFF
jgi:methylmalonyl-CoA mutase N-terminal domain/subunit